MHLMSASHAKSLTGCCSSTVNAGFKSISSESLRAYKKIDCSEARGTDKQLQITIAHIRKYRRCKCVLHTPCTLYQKRLHWTTITHLAHFTDDTFTEEVKGVLPSWKRVM